MPDDEPWLPLSLVTTEPAATPSSAPAPTRHELLSRSVEELELSVRTANCLQNENIHWIGELVQKTELELLKVKNFGRKSLTEIEMILKDMGLQLGMSLPGWSPPR